MRRVVGSMLGALLVIQSLAVPAFAGGSVFNGTWTSTDFDGSRQTLQVSAGSSPSVVFQDFYASGCDRFGGPATHWVASGTGSIEGNDLLVDFHKSGCGTFLKGGYFDQWTYDPVTDTLLDAVGITWSRVH